MEIDLLVRIRLGVRRGWERRARTNCGCTYILGVTEDFIFPKFLARTRASVDGLVIFSQIRIRFGIIIIKIEEFNHTNNALLANTIDGQ